MPALRPVAWDWTTLLQTDRTGGCGICDMGGTMRQICLVCWLVLGCAWAAGAALVDRIVAVVNGEIITWSELETQMNQLAQQSPAAAADREALRRSVLDSLINDILLRQEAARLQMNVSDADVENELRAFKSRRRLSDTEFQHGLQLQGITLDEFKNTLRQDILRRRILSLMVQRKVVVTEEEIAAYYTAHAQDFRVGRHLTVQIAVLEKKDDAMKVHRALQAGEITLDQVVREYSVGPREKDGILEVAWQDLDGTWRQALADLQPGALSVPFPVHGRWVIARIVQNHETQEGGLDAVRDEIREILARPKLEERFQEYMRALRNKALIDVRLER
jgi:peptidyl-prolyl cis-trans isomerase SurA